MKICANMKKYKVHIDDIIYLEELEIYARNHDEAKQKYIDKREKGEVRDMAREQHDIQSREIIK